MKKNRRIKGLLIGLILLSGILPTVLKAQENTQSYHVAAEYNYLYSTHSTKFRGPSILIDKDISNHWNIGFGVGYNTCSYHFDNNLDLKNLKFIPVFARAQYTIARFDLFEPYLIAKTGITFMDYDKREADLVLWKEGKSPDSNPAPYEKVNEEGLYFNMGCGTNINISKRWQSYVNLVFLGYKMSTNNLDINPHGVAVNIGLRFKL